MNIYFSASDALEAQKAYKAFTNRYKHTSFPEEADVIVSLGGDGQATRDIRTGIETQTPIFGINYGHLGHFMNAQKGINGLKKRILNAEVIELSPLRVEAKILDDNTRGTLIKTDFAVNEINVCNDNRGQAIYLRVFIDDIERISKLGGDGMMVATTIGSTGYSKSAHGCTVPLGDDLLAFTPNNAFLPESIRPAVIRPRPIRVEVLEPSFRKANVFADYRKLGEAVKEVLIELDMKNKYKLLFDPGYSIHEKVMRTQFPNCTSGPGVF